MAKYRVLTKSFINNSLVEEGAVIDYDGVPSDNLEPMDAPAEKAAEQSGSANTESIVRQKAAALGGDPNAVDTTAATSAAAAAAQATLQGGSPEKVGAAAAAAISPAAGLV